MKLGGRLDHEVVQRILFRGYSTPKFDSHYAFLTIFRLYLHFRITSADFHAVSAMFLFCYDCHSFFSSPERLRGKLIVWFGTVFRPPAHFQMTSVGQFYIQPPGNGGVKFYSNRPGRLTKVNAMPIYGTNLKIFRTAGPNVLILRLATGD